MYSLMYMIQFQWQSAHDLCYNNCGFPYLKYSQAVILFYLSKY